MGRSLLVSSPKAASTSMKSILALVLLGVAIIHLGGATEEETDTQVAQQESQLDLIQVQELADARKGNKCGKGKKNCRRTRMQSKNSGKNKCRKKGKKGKCRKHKKKKTSETRKIERCGEKFYRGL